GGKNVQVWGIRQTPAMPQGDPYHVAEGVAAVAFTRDGNYLAVKGSDGLVRLIGFGYPPGPLGPPIKAEGEVSVAGVTIPDVARALVRHDEQTLRVVDLLSGDDVGDEVKLGGKVRQVWTAPSYRHVVVLDDADTLTEVDLSNGKRIARVKSEQPI